RGRGAVYKRQGHFRLYGEDFARDPEATYTRMRATGPASWALIAPGVEVVVVTSHPAALQTLRSPRYSKDARRWRALAEGRIPPDSPVLPMMGRRPSLLFADAEHHRRLRAPIEEALADVTTPALRADIRTLADGLVDTFAATGRVDAVVYAGHLVTVVLAHLLGSTSEQGERMARACAMMIDAEPATAQRGSADLAAALNELIVQRRRLPGRDVTSRLLAAPEALNDEEMLHQLVVLIGAGTVPTSAWLTSTLWLLLTDERFGVSLSGGSLSTADALQEALWRHSPMANFSVHYLTGEVPYELEDPTGRLAPFVIPPGVPVLISHAAANTDPGALQPSDRAGSPTGNRGHLAWSAGPHVCPARDLAGVIAEVGIEALLDRLPDIELACDPRDLTWRPGPFHRALTSLPVTFQPTQPQNRGGSPWTQPDAPSPSTPPVPTSTARPRPSAPGHRRPRFSFPGMFRRGR
ncbi:cytochrome P450, partial [Streptomyces calidiresistens]|uniref:cytochrome P450 n=1 Tax=Streptomyces calidiresistens TaxID=1485586 RepID=UPI001E523324